MSDCLAYWYGKCSVTSLSRCIRDQGLWNRNLQEESWNLQEEKKKPPGREVEPLGREQEPSRREVKPLGREQEPSGREQECSGREQEPSGKEQEPPRRERCQEWDILPHELLYCISFQELYGVLRNTTLSCIVHLL